MSGRITRAVRQLAHYRQEMATQPFHVQSTAADLRDGFPWFAWHESISSLWSKRWRPSCAAGIYPFSEGEVDDFDPVFAELVERSGDDPAVLNRPDDYAVPFLPVARQLVTDAEQALAGGDTARARELFLRAGAVYRIARFPINRSPTSQDAWEKGKAAYERAGLLLDPPSTTVEIPFAHAEPAAGDRAAPIPAYLRVPAETPPEGGWPVVLFICGLDAYRTDHTYRTQAHVERGCAVLSLEIPGTGDCPAAPGDPTSSERLMSSVLDWVVEHAGKRGLDPARIIARAVSTGGYHAFRVAHTHAERLFGAVAQGGGCHRMFEPAWIHHQDQMEYPFALAEALAWKFGYRDADPAAALARYAHEGRKFSLVDSGVVGTPSCRLLVINGMEDSIFPVEDSLLVATDGAGKDLVIRGDRRHMGNPGAEEEIYRWIDDVLAAR